MKTTVRLAIVAVLTVAFLAMMSACNGTPDPQPQTAPTPVSVEDELRAQIPEIADRTDQQIDQSMDDVCADLGAGFPPQTVAMQVSNVYQTSEYNGGYFVGASIREDCPQFKSLIQ